MLNATTVSEPPTATHRAKLAYVYVRQSSVQQVRQHQESTGLQCHLVERAVGLGWPDGSYSVQGAAEVLGIIPQTVFDYLGRGLLHGRQLTKGQPWQIDVVDE